LRRLQLEVGAADAGERLDRFIAARGGISRGEARRALDAGGVFLDGKRCKTASRETQPGQKVVVNLEEGGQGPAKAAKLGRERLLFADAHLVAVDKPAGVPSQATLTGDRGTLPDLVEGLLDAPVFLVHRLDRETSGVMLLARTQAVANKLSALFEKRVPKKTYLALCSAVPWPPEGRIDVAMGPDPQRPGARMVRPDGHSAVTSYRTLEMNGAVLVEAQPETGRTHQIRVHLAHAGAPLLGDRRYRGPAMVGEIAIPRVMLHAKRLELPHPITGDALVFEAPVPEDFSDLARRLVDQATMK
jgi:23S rRNA pseudouridine1911/1915/1917 synthase